MLIDVSLCDFTYFWRRQILHLTCFKFLNDGLSLRVCAIFSPVCRDVFPLAKREVTVSVVFKLARLSQARNREIK